ncbi:class I SAM-dependent methyltransferase [Actinocatenispora comari]|jgi:SAM-dependent methyltransferase|uniref:Methyltransferase n=1 Tax=Actinocatenispora comari TaxID=2807577 RepID=A0A8J4AAI4_9ACTN|nr:class I SAM-dependent methyltransferase [Actinocatenispora comari]GIL25592.1 methyltransferase [Actinocatenispora comari]
MPTGYSFDNAGPAGARQLDQLGEAFDGHTTSILTEYGVGRGWRCLDIGAGAGSIAGWLADRVGPEGHVTATDVDPRYLTERDNLTVLRHDVRRDPVPAGEYDLIHARMVFVHLPNRNEVLGRLVSALRPGGLIVLSDCDCRERDPVLAVPDPADAKTFELFNDIIRSVGRRNGADLGWTRYAYAAMRTAGLAPERTVVFGRSWPGGSAGCGLYQALAYQIEPTLRADGMTDEQLGTLHRLLDDPGFVISAWLMHTTVGRRPGGDPGRGER